MIDKFVKDLIQKAVIEFKKKENDIYHIMSRKNEFCF